jgi:hypothetical protein
MGRWQTGKTLSVMEVRASGGLIHGTCDGLIEGSEYMFRIKAVNKGGPSLPSDPSDSMIAKTRFSKYGRLASARSSRHYFLPGATRSPPGLGIPIRHFLSDDRNFSNVIVLIICHHQFVKK